MRRQRERDSPKRILFFPILRKVKATFHLKRRGNLLRRFSKHNGGFLLLLLFPKVILPPWQKNGGIPKENLRQMASS